jgi:predicted Zn-dependent protease
MLGALTRQERFLARTRGKDEARSIPEWARTHPLTENRIARAREAAAQGGLGPDEHEEVEAPFLRELDGLLYGDDPEQGFVQGRRFAHPVMRIAFEAPQGFTLTNSPQAILIEGPDGTRGEFGGAPMPPGGVEDYTQRLLRALLGETPVEAGAPVRTRVNGVPALFLPVTVQARDGAVPLTLAVYEGAGGSAFHFAMLSRPGTAPAAGLETLFRSFRLLTAEEAASLRPRRIRVARTGAGDTLQSLAARMASDAPLDLFLMLNDRTPDRPVRAGEMVKLVEFAPRQE